VGFPAALGPPQNPPRLARERYSKCMFAHSLKHLKD